MTTDVIHNDLDSPDPRELAAQLQSTPVYVLPIGNTRQVRDVILQSVLAPNIAMRNDDVVIEASLQAYDCAGETCVVELMQDGEVVARQAVDFDSEAATRKAKDILKVAVSRARWLYPQDEEQISVTDAALVIGGGVAGIQAALDLADAGHKVYLVEKKPSIGGIMAQLDKVYPDIECSI